MLLKCPIKNCIEGYVATYKGYKNYYKLKKGARNEENSALPMPRWQYGTMRTHLLEIHSCDQRSNDDLENDSSNLDSSNEENSTSSDGPVNKSDEPSLPSGDEFPFEPQSDVYQSNDSQTSDLSNISPNESRGK